MKKYLVFLLMLLVSSGFLLAQQEDEADDDAPTAMYIGADGCKKCHRTTRQGEQFKIWEASQHAKAYETLKSEQSQKIAKERGLEKAAHEADACLKCHVTAYDVDASMKKASFDMTAGVQCESCHGPGSKYKKRSVMKDRAKSIAAGMTDIQVGDGSAEKHCKTCHNEESPTFKGFKFEEMWKKIAHPVPEG